MTVTIITESVMAHLRAGDTCASVIPRGILRRRQSSPPPPTHPHPVPAGFPAVPSWPPCCVSHQMRHSNEPSVHKEADHATSDEAPDLCPSGGHSLDDRLRDVRRTNGDEGREAVTGLLAGGASLAGWRDGRDPPGVRGQGQARGAPELMSGISR